MWGGADAIVVLPGGSGTADEVFEAITQKRLGAHRLPIFIVNVGGYYDGLLGFLEHAAREGFMSREQFLLWQTVSNVSEVVPLILAGISQAPCSAN